MANELCTSLGLMGKDLSGKLLQIVEEHSSNASFMINSLMWNASRSDTAVCLLALQYSTPHYQDVTKKLGFNLKTAIENKTAIIMEPFKLLMQNTGDFIDIDFRNEDNLKRLFFDVKETLSTISGKKCLMIDDLSALMCLGSSVALVVAFVQYLRSLQDTDKDLGLIICSHCSEENDDQKLLSNFIAHVADYRMTIAGLKTGFSTAVTGSIDVVDNLEDNSTSTGDNRLFHFKLTDRQIKVFAPGTVGYQL